MGEWMDTKRSVKVLGLTECLTLDILGCFLLCFLEIDELWAYNLVLRLQQLFLLKY